MIHIANVKSSPLHIFRHAKRYAVLSGLSLPVGPLLRDICPAGEMVPAEVDTEGFQQSKCFRIYYIFLSYDSYIIYKNIMVHYKIVKQ